MGFQGVFLNERHSQRLCGNGFGSIGSEIHCTSISASDLIEKIAKEELTTAY